MTLSTNETPCPGAQRIMALWFPHLPADRIMRRRYGRSWRSRGANDTPPLVFSRHENNTQYVTALDARAEALGLRIDIGVAEARAMHPAIEVTEADPEADTRLLESLADWCDRYTPLVALEGRDGLFLDITGCAHLFDGEQAMLDAVLSFLSCQGFDVRAGLASTPGTAWATARYANGTVVPAGNEAELIAPLPLAALRLEPAIRVSLHSVGLRVAGALMNAPRAPLVRRFGRMVTLRLDQALGCIEEPISPRLPIPPLMAERHFADPISLMGDIEALIIALARQLKSELEQRGEGAQSLQLQLFRVDGAVTRVTIAASCPLRDPALIQKLFHERLAASTDEIDAGYGFDLVRLCIMACTPLGSVQTDLGGGDADEPGDIAHFADRMRTRLGEHAICRSVLLESHWPERAVQSVPFSESGISTSPTAEIPPSDASQAKISGQNGSKERPIRLFHPPEYVEVTIAEVPEGPPGRFRWRQVSYRVARAEGPERIAPEWWREERAVSPRDYFRIEDDEGRRYWLYREGLHDGTERPPRWYMQGLFA